MHTKHVLHSFQRDNHIMLRNILALSTRKFPLPRTKHFTNHFLTQSVSSGAVTLVPHIISRRAISAMLSVFVVVSPSFSCKIQWCVKCMLVTDEFCCTNLLVKQGSFALVLIQTRAICLEWMLFRSVHRPRPVSSTVTLAKPLCHSLLSMHSPCPRPPRPLLLLLPLPVHPHQRSASSWPTDRPTSS